MAYQAWSVVFGEQPTAAKWNILGTNDASFHDGTGIDDDAILTRHVLDENITSPKLAEAFLKGRRRNISTNVVIGNYRIQIGWDYSTGGGAFDLIKAITFPVAFSGTPIVVVSGVGARSVASGAPTELSDLATSYGGGTATSYNTNTITASGFNIQGTRADSSVFSNTFNWGFTWIAIGPA